MRLAGAYTDRNGFTTNDITNNRIDGRDLYSTRFSASLKPASTFRADFTWEHFHEDDNRARTAKQLCHRDDGPESIGSVNNLGDDTRGFLSQGCKPGSLYDAGAYGVPNGVSLPYVQLGQDAFLGQLGGAVTILTPYKDPYAGTTQTHDLRRISSITDPIYRADANLFELNMDWDVADNLALTSQTAYNKDSYYSTQDHNRFNTVPIFNSSDGLIGDDGMPAPANTPGGIYNDPQLGPSNRLVAQDLVTAKAKQFSQELRISTTGNGPFQGTFGGNYTYSLTGRSGVQWSPETSFTSDTIVYFTYSRGYKAGGTNPRPIGFSKEPIAPGSPPFVQLLSYPQTFKPEFVNALELGTKNTLWNNKLTLNLTGYYYDFKNYQVSQIEDRQAISENFNAKIYGFEGEAVFRPNAALAINANIGLQNSRLGKNQYSIEVMDRLQGHEDEYTLIRPFVQLPSNCVVKKSVVEPIIAANRASGSPGNGYPESGVLFFVCPGSGLSSSIPADAFPNGGRGFYANVGGNEVPNAPHLTFNIGAEYNVPFASDLVVTPRVDF